MNFGRKVLLRLQVLVTLLFSCLQVREGMFPISLGIALSSTQHMI